jgi:thiamine biosynthesis protein ThiC
MHKSFKDGGMGFLGRKAERMINYIEKVIERRKDLGAVYDILNNHPELPIKEEIRQIREWLLANYKLKMTPIKVMAIDQVISDRLKGYITAEQFTDLLNRPISKFGAGLSFRTAHQVTEKMELILASGGRAMEDEFVKTIEE